jgi:chromate transporter
VIYLELFLTFLQIGAFSFGGGYGMISLIREEVLSRGWLTEEALLNMIAVAESTPGPIAVNMATFVGSAQGGILGSAVATLGVVLPSFVIILMIAMVLRGLLKYAGVKAFLGGVRPCVVGLIIATAATMLISRVAGVTTLAAIAEGDRPAVDLRAAAILGILALTAALGRKLLKKSVSPILLILLSAALGVVLYGL